MMSVSIFLMGVEDILDYVESRDAAFTVGDVFNNCSVDYSVAEVFLEFLYEEDYVDSDIYGGVGERRSVRRYYVNSKLRNTDNSDIISDYNY